MKSLETLPFSGGAMMVAMYSYRLAAWVIIQCRSSSPDWSDICYCIVVLMRKSRHNGLKREWVTSANPRLPFESAASRS